MTTNPPPGNFEERLPRGSRDPLDYAFVRPTGSPDDARTLGDWVAYVLTLAASLAPSALLDAIKTVDGSGSGLDADLLDGQSSGAFALVSGASPFTGGVTISAANPFVAFVDSDTNADSRISANSAVGGLLIEADYNNEVANSTILFNIDGTLRLTITPAQMTYTGASGFLISSATPVLRLTDTDTNAQGLVSVDQAAGNMFIAADNGNALAGTVMEFSVDAARIMRLTGGGGLTVGTGPTGGDKGAGTINAGGVIYENNVEVAKLSGAAFTGAVSVNTSGTPLSVTTSAAANAIIATSTDAGAGVGPLLVLDRNSASPAANDVIGGVYMYGRDSAANQDPYGLMQVVIADPTSTSEDSYFDFFTMVAGSSATRLRIGGGIYHSSATGGDKGNNTANFGAVYDDNVLLTCMAMAETFLETGKFSDADVAEWDARVPDQIEPARTEERAVTEKVEEQTIVRERDGSYRLKTVTVERQVTEIEPVYAEDGLTGVDMIEAPVFEIVEIPERVIPRTHAAARVFKAMIDDGFDPRDPAAYIRKMRADEALPGMPTKKDWQHNAISSGEMMSRLWLATELLALAFATLAERVAALEAR